MITSGRSAYQILTPDRSSPADHLSAQRLQDGLFAMTGVRLPVRNAAQRVAGHPAILIGGGAEPGLWDKDWYEIAPNGQDLRFAGSGGRGTHYAVSAFLESLGARFYAPGSERFPHLKHVALPAKTVRSTAALSYRHVFYPTAQTPEWATRWKLNVHNGQDACWGVNAKAHSWGHSFSALVPLETHFKTNPEYFSFIDGARRDRQTQLCCTNPDVADVASETMAKWIAANPKQRIFAVGMNDWDGWCECPECRKVDEREGGPTGQLLTLVNRVAERFPDRIISTLAYAWAIDPPKRMHARDNVLIVLCHNEGCYTHALDGCEDNAQFLRRLRGWKRKSERILIWDYYVNYHSYLMPTPNFRRIAADFRTYRDLGIEAMFCQGSAMPGGQFEGLRQYLQARLLWNPDENASAIIEDWVTGVYGARAGGYILDYLNMLEQHVHKNDVHMTSFGSGQEIQPHIFTPEILKRGKALWDRAERVADDPAKVLAARAPEMCSRLFHTGMTYGVKGGKLRPTPSPDRHLAQAFARAAMQGGAAHLRENAGAPEAFAQHYGRTYEAIELKSASLIATIIPEMGARLFSLRHVPTGLELMHKAELARKVNYLPYGAGYEFSVQPRWQSAGSSEEYRILQRKSDHVVLEADISGKLRVRTEYQLQDDTLRISHTVTNRGDKPATIEPFTHPEWNYKAFGDDAIASRSLASGWSDLPLNPDRRPNRDLEFTADQMPRSLWRITSAASPIVLEERFAAAALQRARLTFGGWGNLNLELYFKRKRLQPGRSATFATQWTIAGR